MSHAPTLHTLWNVPYQRNPFFTGREDMLNRMERDLHAEHSVALSQPQGITGLGGIGKTQTVVEYAYRHREEYDVVLWVRADSATSLISSMVELAQVLDLPEHNEQDQEIIVQAVLHWLHLHNDWLLIYDNIDDLSLAEHFLPKAGVGHLLLTTRAHALGGLAQRLDIQQMDPEIGALLLLRRASLLALQAPLNAASPNDRRIAQTISEELDGLPLALDQAGAYIKETPCSLSEYLARYQARRGDILRVRGKAEDYPSSVATTWSLSFEKVCQAHLAASELLNFCAFLAPDAIPEDLLTAGAAHLGTILSPVVTHPLQFDQVCQEILRFSLLQRGADESTLTMHRLVQAVLRDNLRAEDQQQWMRRVVPATDAALPGIAFEDWPAFERLVPHALISADWIKQISLATPEASHLLDQTGRYLSERARYLAAEPLLQRAVAIREKELGTGHLDTATSLTHLAYLYLNLGKYTEAADLNERALMICEKESGPEQLDTASILNGLALSYSAQKKYHKAEEAYRRAIAIHEKALGSDDPTTAGILNNLAIVYVEQGKGSAAEALYLRVLTLDEKTLGLEHPYLAVTLNNLARLYQDQGRYNQAEELYQRALAIREKTLGLEHSAIAESFSNLASLRRHQKQYAESEQLLMRALELRKKIIGLGHPETETTRSNLEWLYREQEQYAEAEHFFKKEQTECERGLGKAHSRTLWCAHRLATLYQTQGKYAEAEAQYVNMFATCERELPLTDSWIAIIIDELAMTYKNQKKDEETERLYSQAVAVREKELGPMHPSIATLLNNHAYFYHRQRRYALAEPLYLRALAIREQNLGKEHPDIALILTNLAALYSALKRYAESETLYIQASEIWQAAWGMEHQDTLDSFDSLATFYANQERYAEAERLYQRALPVAQHVLGIEHYVTRSLNLNYASMKRMMESTQKQGGWKRLFQPFLPRHLS